MKKDIQKVVKLVEEKVVSILLANDLVTLIDKDKENKFSNCNPTNKARKQLGEEEIDVDDQWMKKFRNLFPKGRQSSPFAIKAKLNRFVADHGKNNMSDIFKAAQLYIHELDDLQYACKANNFFYKYEKDGSLSSYCLEYLERVESGDDVGSTSTGYSGIRKV